MRTVEEVRADLAQVKQDREAWIEEGGSIHARTCALLYEAREHPDLTMETTRADLGGLPRQTVYEHAREGAKAA